MLGVTDSMKLKELKTDLLIVEKKKENHSKNFTSSEIVDLEVHAMFLGCLICEKELFKKTDRTEHYIEEIEKLKSTEKQCSDLVYRVRDLEIGNFDEQLKCFDWEELLGVLETTGICELDVRFGEIETGKNVVPKKEISENMFCKGVFSVPEEYRNNVYHIGYRRYCDIYTLLYLIKNKTDMEGLDI